MPCGLFQEVVGLCDIDTLRPEPCSGGRGAAHPPGYPDRFRTGESVAYILDEPSIGLHQRDNDEAGAVR